MSTVGLPASSAFEMSAFAIGHRPKARGFLRHGMLPVLGCLVLMALGAAPALATPKWSSSVNLVEPMHHHSAEEPQIAVDAKGDAVAAWLYDNEGVEAIYASVRPASTGIWGTPTKLSTYKIAYGPHVAIDAEGEAVVIWEASNDSGVSYIVQAATGSASTGIWKSAVNVSPEHQISNSAELALNATGEAVTIWRSNSGLIEGAVGSAGAWQTPSDISGASPDARSPQVTIDSHGDAVAVWEAYNGTEEFIAGTSRPAAGSWQTPVTLTEHGVSGRFPEVAADASGDVIAAWGTAPEHTVQSVMGSAASGTWQAPVNVSTSGSGPGNQQVSLAVNARGEAVASWESNTPEELGQAASGSAVTGKWQTPTAFTPNGERVNNSRVAIDPQGDALVVWTNKARTLVKSAAMPTGSESFSAPVILYTSEGVYEREELNGPQVAFGGAGIGVAVWENGEEDSNFPNAVEPTVQAAVYGAVPSVITGPSSAVEQTSATVTGTVNPNGGEVTACYFEYGTSTSYGSRATCSQAVGSGEAGVAVSAALTDLSPETTYYYRVVAKDTAGLGEGNPKMFTTPAATPTTHTPSPTTTTTATTTTPVVTTVAPQPSPVLECTTAQVALINVVQKSSHVLITGAARLSLVGKRVSIKFLASGKTVASATIAANGSFSASAPLPPAKIRESNRARYEASVGSTHSLNLKLTRRMYMTSATRSGAHVLLSGYVTGSFKAGALVKILARVTCSSEQVVAKVKLTRAGKFSATVPAPKGAASQIAVYRGTTTVLAGGRPETTYTLPTPPSA